MDSNFYYELIKESRPLTRIEACFLLTNDLNYNRNNTISFYANQWSWSRHKTRDFIKSIKSEIGNIKNGQKNQKGHPIHMISNDSQLHKDTFQNQKGHPIDNNSNGFQRAKDTCNPKRTPETIAAVKLFNS